MSAKTGLFLFLCVSILLGVKVNAQTFYEKFKALSLQKDTTEQLQLLKQWEAADKNDPELYVCYFNYYINKSRKSVVALDKELPKGYNDKSMVLSDTAGEKAGFLYTDMYYHPDLVQKGFDYISTGIEKFPDRLDMRFGKAHMFSETRDYEEFTKEIIKAVDYSVQIKNKWRWIDAQPMDDGKKFMLETVQGYQMELYDTGDDSLLIYMKRIAEAVLKHYPDHVESLTDLSIYYLIFEKYPAAIEQLLKAEKIAPKDYIVLGNLAQAYLRSGDKQNAKKYYELTAKYGDDSAKEMAEDALKDLK